MISFGEALDLNPNMARRLGTPSADELRLAGALWNAVQGVDGYESGSYAEALYEAAPSEHAVILRMGGAAASQAWLLAWGMRHEAQARQGFNLRKIAKSVWSKFSEKANAIKFVHEGFGCDESDAWEHERDSGTYGGDLTDVRAVAELAGRMYSALKGARSQQPSQAPEEIYSVCLGAELSRLLPSELAHLGQPTEILLFERLADKRALCYAVRGQEHSSRGPLVLLLDESSSMKNQRLTWSKAAAIALARVAHDDGRPVMVVRYSTVMSVMEMKPGDWNAYLKLARCRLGGGTVFHAPLVRAVEEVRRLAARGDRGADVVLVTDGQRDGRDSDAIIHEDVTNIEATGARLWTVAIDVDFSERDPLRARAEKYVHVGRADMNSGNISVLSGSVNPK